MFRYPLSCNLINVFSCFLWKGTNNSWEQVFIIECAEFWEIYFLVDWKFLAISFLNFSISCHFCLLWPRTPNKQSDGCKALEHISSIPVFPEEDKIPDVPLPAFPPWRTEHFLELGLPLFQWSLVYFASRWKFLLSALTAQKIASLADVGSLSWHTVKPEQEG